MTRHIVKPSRIRLLLAFSLTIVLTGCQTNKMMSPNSSDNLPSYDGITNSFATSINQWVSQEQEGASSLERVGQDTVSSGESAPIFLSDTFVTQIEEPLQPSAPQPQAQSGLRGERTNALIPTSGGLDVYETNSVSMDVTNSAEGYVLIRYSGNNPKIKVQITKEGGSTYTYNLNSNGIDEAFPFSAGSGNYTIHVFENVSGTSYAQVASHTVNVALRSSMLPFLYANQYVSFKADSETVKLGTKLAATANNDLEVIENVYNYVIKNITYDYQKANTVTSGYLPNVDSILSSKSGICFDYAAVMTTMLRTQGIPTKLVVGYAGKVYHAWISTYIADIGWVNGIIYFDGESWTRMDPTFASNGNSSAEIMKYIGDGSNYNAMYYY